MSDDLRDEELQLDLDSRYAGLPVSSLEDEDMLAIMEGAAEELSFTDYASLKSISDDCIVKMYRVVEIICGAVGASLAKRYAEINTHTTT